jgi:large subunit ribosomal protein L3
MLGRKMGMTQIFGPNGVAIPVTVIEAGPCVVTQVKTAPHDGYEAVQLGFGTKKPKHVTRPEMGHLGHTLPLTERQRRKQQQEQAKARSEARAKSQTAKSQTAKSQTAKGAETTSATETEAEQAEAATAPQKQRGGRSASQSAASKRARAHGQALGPFAVLREVKVIGETPALGETITLAMFSEGEAVDVIGTSKGKGFAGVMKRHGFRGGPRTHGQSDRARAPGSIGPGTTPGRVFKGTRMAGRMGNARVTIKGLQIIQADPERNLLVIQGSIPGPNGGLVVIRKSAEAQNAARTASGQTGR